MYLPLLEIVTLEIFFYNLLGRIFLVYRVLESQTINDGFLPIYPVTTRFLEGLRSKQMISSL
jgi:hypothetical protein